MHIKGTYCLLSIPLRYPPEQRLSLSKREQGCSGSPPFYVFHGVIQSLSDATVWDTILHKYTDLQSTSLLPSVIQTLIDASLLSPGAA